jgi:hypothetical protein
MFMMAFLLAPIAAEGAFSASHSVLEGLHNQRDCSEASGANKSGRDCCLVCVAAVTDIAAPSGPNPSGYSLNLPEPETRAGIVPEPLKKPPRRIN